MDVSSQDRSPTVHNRRWYQYSLRSQLLFVTLCAIACSWLTVKIDRGKKQKAAVDALKAKGFTIAYDYEVDRDGKLVPNAALNVPQWLRSWLGDDCFATVGRVAPPPRSFSVVGLFPIYPDVTDEDLGRVAELPHLKFLWLSGERIGDSALKRMRDLPELERLYLENTEITDAGLAMLKAFPNLRKLDVSYTNVTDGGMADLLCLTRLEEINLAQTFVTDRGLVMLQNLKTLKRLSFVGPGGTQVTPDGVAKFKQALPDCKVEN